MNNKISQAERLAAIEKRRSLISKQLKQKKRSIRHSYKELMSPAPTPIGRLGSFVASAGTIAAIADGALMGYRLYKKVRKIF